MSKQEGKKVKLKRKDSQKLKSEESKFFKAIHDEDETTVRSCLKDREFISYLKETDKLTLAFVQVILLNNVRLLKLLVDHGIDVHSQDSFFQENGIMHAARYGHTEMIECLIHYGVGINYQSENGSTALHVAVENGKHDSLEMLVKQRGIDLNIKDCSGYSPLLWTGRLRDWKAMKTLIDAGCNVESGDFCNGINVLHIVVDQERAYWKGKLAGPQDYLKCIDVCVNAGVDINKRDIYGNPPLVYAVKYNYLHAVKHLLKLNCDINKCLPFSSVIFPFSLNNDLAPDNCSLYLLYLAISRFEMSTVKALCAAGVKYHLLAREPGVFRFLAENYKSMKEVLEDLVWNPMSLKQAARNVIRESIQGNMSKVAHQLQLPASLVSYICLEDIDTM